MKWENMKSNFERSTNDITIELKHDCELHKDNETFDMIVSNVKFIDINGYLRVLGSDTFNYYNEKIKQMYPGEKRIVAHDVFGGFFCINNGDFSGEDDYLWYFAPDTLEWEELEINYDEFIQWICSNGVVTFYESFLCEDIKNLLVEVDINEGILIYPFLWANECNVETATKKIVPFLELVRINEDYRNQLLDD